MRNAFERGYRIGICKLGVWVLGWVIVGVDNIARR
jgi:hypothetical protein